MTVKQVLYVTDTSGQTMEAGSINEWNVAQAAHKLKVEFYYQYPIFGGRTLPGGQVIDFLFLVAPRPVPIFIQGEYWHGGKRETESLYKLMEVQAAKDGEWAPPVALRESETMTIDASVVAIRQNVGVMI